MIREHLLQKRAAADPLFRLRDGLVAAWEERYSMAATTGDFLQVVPGPSWFCEHHARQVRRLDDPDAAPAPRANRAQRRARSKGKQGRQ